MINVYEYLRRTIYPHTTLIFELIHHSFFLMICTTRVQSQRAIIASIHLRFPKCMPARLFFNSSKFFTSVTLCIVFERLISRNHVSNVEQCILSTIKFKQAECFTDHIPQGNWCVVVVALPGFLEIAVNIALPANWKISTNASYNQWVNSLSHGRFGWKLTSAIFKLNSMIDGWGISYEKVIRWTTLNLTDHKSTLVQVMAWCRQATSHYLNQCWPRSVSPNGVTMPQWVTQLSE